MICAISKRVGNFVLVFALYLPRVLDTFVYNLLPNHFHVVVRIKPKAEIVPAPARVPGVVDFPSLRDLVPPSVRFAY